MEEEAIVNYSPVMAVSERNPSNPFKFQHTGCELAVYASFFPNHSKMQITKKRPLGQIQAIWNRRAADINNPLKGYKKRKCSYLY